MKAYKIFLLVGIFILFVNITMSQDKFIKYSSVSGNVINKLNQPIPGLTVYLVHPLEGRSNPALTNNEGKFVLSKIPVRSDKYYIEIYWGKKLMYRQVIIIDKIFIQYPTIRL